MDIRNKLVFLWSHCDFPDTGGVLGASDVSAAQLVHAALLRLFSAVVSLSCSNFCWSFLPHWQISGKSLFVFCFYSFLFLKKLNQMKLKMNYLPFFLSVAKCYSWCLMRSREKLLGCFLVDLIHVVSLNSCICWPSAILFTTNLIQIRVFCNCFPYQILLGAPVWHQCICIYLFNIAFRHWKSWSCMSVCVPWNSYGN